MAILKDTIIKGALRVIGKIYGTFVGNLTGNVTGNITGNVTGNCSGSSGSCTGNAATATKLGTATVGSITQPIYLNAGTATATTYSLGKSVPSNALFTDTDTKNTAGSTDTSSKIYLIGATSQAANPQTYSDSEVYVTNGTLYCVKTQDAAGGSNNKPAIIIGGVDTSSHIEIDANEIMAKSNGTTTSALYLNNDGGAVYVNSKKVVVGNNTGTAIGSANQPVYITANGDVSTCTAYSSASVNYATSSGSASKVTLTETTEQDVEKPLLFKDSAGNIQYNPSIRYLIKYNNSEDIPSYLKIGGTTTADYGYISLASSYNETDKIWSYLHLVPNVSEETNISFCAEGRCVVDNSTAAQNINGTFLVKINRSTGSISRSTSTIGSSLQPVYVNTGKVDVCANVGYKLLNDTYYHPSQTASTYYKFLKIGTGFIGQIGIWWNDRGVSGGSFLTLNINTMYNSNYGSCRGSYNVIATGIGSTYMKYGWSSSTSGEGYLGIMLYPTTDGCSFKDVYIMNGNNYSLVTFEYNATGGTAAALGYGNNVYSVKKVTMS